jgi:hypothetical protein
MCRQKKVGELRDDLGAIQLVLTPSLRKPQCSPPKNEPLSQLGDAFENTAFQQWFENGRGCRKAVLHLFVKQQIPPTDSWHQVDSDIGAISIILCQH